MHGMNFCNQLRSYPRSHSSTQQRRWLRWLTAAALVVGIGTAIGQPAPAQAGPPHPLELLPQDRLLTLAPLLRSSDLALMESDERGGIKQITVMSLSTAPPELVYDVVIHPERYGDFVRNMTRSEVKKLTDGSLEHTYEFSYKILDINGVHRYVAHPGAPGAIEIFDVASYSDGARHFRWEFLPAGAGTLIVMYGYTDLSHSGGVVEQLRSRFPTLDFGMGLVGQMAQVLAMKSRAEQMAGVPRSLPAAGGADYGFLLDRGTVVLMRSQAGRLTDLSMVDRSTAQADKLLLAAQRVPEWSQYVPSVKSSEPAGNRDGTPIVELTQTLPLLTFTTRFGVQASGNAVDLYGFSGDLSGSRLRFDVRGDANGRSQLVFRSSQAFDRASFVIRQLYKLEPLFEYGVNVGLAMLIQRGAKYRGEQLSREQSRL